MEKRKIFRNAIKIVLGLLGAFLCARLIVAAGWPRIVAAFAEHGDALILLTAIYTVYHIWRTWTLRICTLHPVRFIYLFGVRLAGEGVAYVAIGNVFGDALKVILARKEIPVVEGATGVFAEKLIYHLAGAGFVIGGLLAAVIRLGAHPVFLYSIAGMVVVFVLFVYLLSSGIRPMARLLRNIRERNAALRQAILRTEEGLFQFRKEHSKKFHLVFLLDLASYFYSIGEVFAILHLLGIPCSFWDLWYYQAVVKVMSSAATIVPANLGVFESTNVLLAQQLHFGDQAGLIVALFVRIRAILWSLIGFGVFVHLLKQE